MQASKAAWVLVLSAPGGGVQVLTLSGTSTPCARMHLANAVTVLDGAVVGLVTFGPGLGAADAEVGAAPVGVGVGAVLAPGDAAPPDAAGEPRDTGGGADAAPPPPPPQPAADISVAASSSAAGPVRAGIGFTSGPSDETSAVPHRAAAGKKAIIARSDKRALSPG